MAQWTTPITIENETRTATEWLRDIKAYGGFTHRGCASFLTSHGFPVDHKQCRSQYGELPRCKHTTMTPLPIEFDLDPAYWNHKGGSKKRVAENRPPEPALSTVGSKSYTLDSTETLTADDLMQKMGLDPNKWEVTAFEARLKDIINRNEHKDLTVQGGLWDGSVNATPTITQLYAYTLKVKPRSTIHTPKVIRLYPTITELARREHKDTQRSMLLVSDPQIGFRGHEAYHDRRVLSIALDVAQCYNPDYIVFNGDLLDFEQFGRWASGKTSNNDVQRAIYETAYWLLAFREACPSSQIDILEGNHDMRLRSTIGRTMPHILNLAAAAEPGVPLLGLRHILGLDAINVRLKEGWPGNDVWYGSELRVMHGERYSSTPGGTVAAILKDADHNTITGHSHHSEVARKNRQGPHGPRTITAISLPCACRIDGSVPGRTANPDWHQGIGLVEFDLASPLLSYRCIEVRNGKALHAGVVIYGDDGAHEAAIMRQFKEEWDE